MITKKQIREVIKTAEHNPDMVMIEGRVVSFGYEYTRPGAGMRGEKFWSLNINNKLSFYYSKTDLINGIFNQVNKMEVVNYEGV